MTDVVSTPVNRPLTLVGDPTAAVCIGDSCAIPDHHEEAVVSRRLDDDLV